MITAQIKAFFTTIVQLLFAACLHLIGILVIGSAIFPAFLLIYYVWTHTVIYFIVLRVWLLCVGLALAYSITAVAEASLLLFFLYKEFKIFKIKEISKSFYKILISSIAMAIPTILIRQWLVLFNFVSLQTFWGVFFQLVLSGVVGIIFYLSVSFILKSSELKTIKDSFFKRIK